MGKILIIIGIIFIILGILYIAFGNIFSWFGHLPGDIRIEKENFKFYAPLTSGIVISIFLSLIAWIINIIMKKL
ncbi:MAG TPA: DUF2905 domain-containing protein [Bacteroidetes bacterium]|nr:DUF2905 domain-containing protein [Bacteroidota bacterium]